ncbi:hypothetical protein CYD30_20010 [Kosakonia cowanii]|nr:hypothetical protein CYD30_20010 [Kosakonia cowanii]
MRNKNNALILALLGGLGLSAANAEQPDALKGVKSAVSMQQPLPSRRRHRKAWRQRIHPQASLRRRPHYPLHRPHPRPSA